MLLGLARKIEKHHRHNKASLPRAMAANDHSLGADSPAFPRGLQMYRHFRPGGNGMRGEEFDAVFADMDRIEWKGEACFSRGGFRPCCGHEHPGSVKLAAAHNRLLEVI